MTSSYLPSVHSTPSCYYPFLFKVLGRLTEFTADVFVPHQKVIDETLIEAGFDLENLCTPIPRKSLSPPGLDRVVSIAFRALRECVSPCTKQGPKRGLWGLTEEGVQVARELASEADKATSTPAPKTKKERKKAPQEAPSSRTHQWFQDKFGRGSKEQEVYYQAMLAAVRRALPISVEAGMEEDHVHNCFVKLLRRQAFEERVIKGRSITPSHMATYTARSGWTDVRDSATEPLTREYWGARTPKERKKKAKTVENPAFPLQVAWQNFDADSPSWELHDPCLGDVTQDLEDTERLKNILEELDRRLRVLNHHAKPAFRTLVLRMQGDKVPEIAEKMNKTNRQITSLLSKARKVLGSGFRDYLRNN